MSFCMNGVAARVCKVLGRNCQDTTVQPRYGEHADVIKTQPWF